MSIEGTQSEAAVVENLNAIPASQEISEATAELKAEPKQEPEKDDRFAAKFAALTRKEKILRAKEQEISQKVAEMEKKVQEAEQRASKYNEVETGVKSNPLKWLQDTYGITYDQLTEMALNEGNPTPQMQMQRLKEELDGKYSKQFDEMKKSLAEKEEIEAKKVYDNAKTNYLNEAKSFVESNEKYELIQINDAYNLLLDVAEEYYKNTGEIPDLEVVADAVEADLEEEANKVLKAKKLMNKLQPQKSESKQTAPTLSNTSASQVPKNGERKLSNEESLAEAAKLIKWME